MKKIFILTLVQDSGFDGIYTSNLVSSQDNNKLKNIQIQLEKTIFKCQEEMQIEFQAIYDKHNHKGGKLHPDIIVERSIKEEEILLKYPVAKKYLGNSLGSLREDEVSFEIKPINFI